MTGIFISYRQDDSRAWSAFLRGELKTVFSEETIFLDRDALRAGNWPEQIASALANCCAMLVVIGPNWLSLTGEDGQRRLDAEDDVHRSEIAAGLADPAVTVIPVLVEGASMPTAAQLPAPIRVLAQCQARQFSVKDSHRMADLRELCEDLVRAGAIPRADTGSAWAAGVHASAAQASATGTLTYVERKLDESQARAAFESWLARETRAAATGAPVAARLKSLELWWVPCWQVAAEVSASWQGRASAPVLAVDPARSQPAGVAVHVGAGLLHSGFLEPVSLHVCLPASDNFGSDLPQLLDDSCPLKVVDSSVAIDTIGQEAEVTVLEGEARAHAQADFRKATLARLQRQFADGVLEVTHLDTEVDDFTARVVWCPVWRGSCFDGAAITTFWVLGHTGQVVVTATAGPLGGAHAAVSPGPAAVGAAPRKKRRGLKLAAGALVLAYIVHACRAPESPPPQVAAPVVRPAAAAAAGQPPVKPEATPAKPGAHAAQARAPAQEVAAPSQATVTPGAPAAPGMRDVPNRPDGRDASGAKDTPNPRARPVQPAATPAAAVQPAASPVAAAQPAATSVAAPQPTRAAAAETRPQVPPVRASAPPQTGGPAAATQNAGQPVTRDDAADVGKLMQSLDEACGRRYLGALARCMRVQCAKPEYQPLRACVDFRRQEEIERKQADTQPGG